MKKRVHLISGPRNISTALMYSFGNRTDFTVVDEPLYAYYLKRTEKSHPGREEVLATYSSDLEEVFKNVFEKDYDTDYLFLKDMAHHWVGIDREQLNGYHHLFLIRNPRKLIASFAKVIQEPSLLDIGLKEEYELLKYIQQHNLPFAVLDTDELLKDPEAILRILCQNLNIPFSKQMLFWPAGPKKEDGNWAKYWYISVHKSTHFSLQKSTTIELNSSLEALYEEALPYYNALFEYAIKL